MKAKVVGSSTEKGGGKRGTEAGVQTQDEGARRVEVEAQGWSR